MTKDAPPPYTARQAGEATQSPFTVSLAGDATNSLLVTVTPPTAPSGDAEKKQNSKRAPVDLCAVIDVSGSMGDDASPPAEDGKVKEDTGLSVLDVVKHAMKTIIATMQDDDRLAIVTFSNEAEVVSTFTTTTEKNKKELMTDVDCLHPLYSTNLWDGLKKGMELFNEIQSSGSSSFARTSSIFLLTDGMPNVNPPRGHIEMLKQYLESNPRSQFTVSTFGFGYSLDSELLSSIAKVGGGGYGFIPDSGMVGTVFVHAVANLYATYATNCVMNVELPEGTTLKTPAGDFPHTPASWGSKVNFGDLQYGQSRDVVLEFEGLKPEQKLPITISVVAKPWFTETYSTVTAVYTPSSSAAPIPDIHKYHIHRLELVSSIYRLASDKHLTDRPEKPKLEKVLDQAEKTFRRDAERIQSGLMACPEAMALSQDIGGEVLLAVSDSKNWRKWGMHYFPSLARSHQRQQCSNFKDAGLQIYGQHSPLFTTSRDEVDAAFDKLPPPKPSRKEQKGKKRTVHSSMSAWNNRLGPCFAGQCKIAISGDKTIRLDELRRGMKVVTPVGDREVGAVLKTKVEDGVREMCQIGDLIVTPWHPVLHDGGWRFPADVSEPHPFQCDSIFSVLLLPHDSVDAHAINVGGTVAVTLGHGIVADGTNTGDIRAHSFFGSYSRVLQSLMNLPGFEHGSGITECIGVIRGTDGLICDFARPAARKEYSEKSMSDSTIPFAAVLV